MLFFFSLTDVSPQHASCSFSLCSNTTTTPFVLPRGCVAFYFVNSSSFGINILMKSKRKSQHHSTQPCCLCAYSRSHCVPLLPKGNAQYSQQQEPYQQGPPQQQGYPPQQQYPGQQGYPPQQQGYGESAFLL